MSKISAFLRHRLFPAAGQTVALLILFTAVQSAVADKSSRAERVVDVIRDPKAGEVLVAAHRGGYANDRKDGAPENSVANVAVAVEKGYDLYETDVQRTADGVFVVVHDPTLERETNGKGKKASDLTLAELKQLKKTIPGWIAGGGKGGDSGRAVCGGERHDPLQGGSEAGHRRSFRFAGAVD